MAAQFFQLNGVTLSVPDPLPMPDGDPAAGQSEVYSEWLAYYAAMRNTTNAAVSTDDKIALSNEIRRLYGLAANAGTAVGSSDHPADSSTVTTIWDDMWAGGLAGAAAGSSAAGNSTAAVYTAAGDAAAAAVGGAANAAGQAIDAAATAATDALNNAASAAAKSAGRTALTLLTSPGFLVVAALAAGGVFLYFRGGKLAAKYLPV